LPPRAALGKIGCDEKCITFLFRMMYVDCYFRYRPESFNEGGVKHRLSG